jgi:hypothetical protein
MLDKNPDIKSLEESGAKVANSKMEVKKVFEFMSELNENSV